MEKDSSFTDGFLWLIVAILGFSVASNLLGRLTRFLVSQWPYFVTGTAVFFLIGIVAFAFYRFKVAFDLQAQKVSSELDRCICERESLIKSWDVIQKRLSDQDDNIKRHRNLCLDFIERIEEAAEQKTPIIALPTQAPDSPVQKAAVEIVGGSQ